MAETQKDVPLEAVRGLATISVVFCHCFSGFYYQLVDEQAGSIFGEPWFFLVNGTGAVLLFFVLSGYVLTRRYLLTGAAQIIVRGVVKRWPRLAGPVLVSTIASYLLFAFGAYHYQEAGEALGSPWLASEAVAATDFSLYGAIVEGGFRTFFAGAYAYNGVLWTMEPEFIGSFVAFGAALYLRQVRQLDGSKLAAGMALGVVILLCHIQGWPYPISFCAGVGLAFFLPRKAEIGSVGALVALAVAAYALGYHGHDVGIFAPLSVWDKFAAHPGYVSTIGAVLVIATIEMHEGTRRALSGQGMAIIGELSFPLYLVHCLVICSAGAAVFLATGSRMTAFALSVLLSFPAAYPLMVFNRKWVGIVNWLVQGQK